MDQSQTVGASTLAMEKKRKDLSPDDKAVIERQIASALCYLYGGTVSEPLPDRLVALLKELSTREVRRQRNLSDPHNDNEADDVLLIQRVLVYALRLSFDRVASEPLSSEIALLLVRLALAETIGSNNESPVKR